MTTPGEFAARFRPRGVCDTISGDNSPPGACANLMNLIPDYSTPACFVCRPANTELIDFSGLPGTPGTAGVCTVAYSIGTLIAGLVGITSGTYSGYDIPFVYDTTTASFLTVSGITTSNVPTSQATSGAWIPPCMTLTGVDLVVTHPGFDGMTNFFGHFDMTTPSSPAWSAGNTATNGLPSVPTACATFVNRTRFVCGNAVYYTDTLDLTMTNSNQSQTLGDYTPVLGLCPLAVSNQTNAIAQGLLGFKENSVYLITGDVATTNLGSNLLTPSVGTQAPRSVVPTPYGVVFMANDGIRTINFLAQLSEPNADLALPFIYSVTPSRVAAAFNSDVYRLCTQNGGSPDSPFQDYWYNFRYEAWTGPHSFAYDTIVPFSNDFALASNAVAGKMWDSYVVQGHAGAGDSFTENGTSLSFVYQPAPMTDLDNIYANEVLRSTIEMAIPAQGQTYSFLAQNESGTTLASASISAASNQPIWGSFKWGQADWGAATSGLLPYTIPWDSEIVCNRMAIEMTGASSLGFRISSFHNAYKRLNYLLN